MSTALDWRRDVHAHPEVGFTEFRTASRVAGHLADLGWTVVVGPEAMAHDRRLGVPSEAELDAAFERASSDGGDPRFLPAMRGGHTAVVASIGEGHPHLAIRADIDALPLAENDSRSHRPAAEGFASMYAGRMHACGHDAHVGMAVELAERLAAEPPPGRVTIVFQPAEEGGRGGRAVAASGLVDDVDLLLALHVGLSLPTGTLLASNDGLLANAKLRATFHGRASHAALHPEEGRNALLGAASATLALQGMTRVAGHETRVAVGRIAGGTSSNIVPDRAEMLLEVRADDGEVCDDLERRAREMLAGAAAMHGLEVEVELVGQVTTAVADPAAVAAVREAASAAGLALVEPVAESGVASDDATALMRRVQEHGGLATYAALGADLAGGHHTPTFDVDEAALPLGVDLLERLARSCGR
ncbi:amidohydrolase [Nocardioides mangrovicus]|uniref:amidohydrolase n=1 Tax=Nocardioides mangrovicus TaxID=2478913 RepID=UPI0013150105|nr:amidohydrolase [Nocardioides mangrovicus]